MFTVDITDQSLLDGISWARNGYNASQPRDDKGNIVGELKDDNEYVSWVMTQAATSYAKQQQLAMIQTLVQDADVATLSTMTAAMRDAKTAAAVAETVDAKPASIA